MSTYIPAFTSPEGETKTLHSYQAILDRWPIPYKELTVSTSFGETHVISSRPAGEASLNLALLTPFGVLALLLLILTRGRLGYHPSWEYLLRPEEMEAQPIP